MEIIHRRLLVTEHFDHFLSVQHLLDKSVHSTQIHLLMDIVSSGQSGEIRCHKEHDDRREYRDDGQRRI